MSLYISNCGLYHVMWPKYWIVAVPTTQSCHDWIDVVN